MVKVKEHDETIKFQSRIFTKKQMKDIRNMTPTEYDAYLKEHKMLDKGIKKEQNKYISKPVYNIEEEPTIEEVRTNISKDNYLKGLCNMCGLQLEQKRGIDGGIKTQMKFCDDCKKLRKRVSNRNYMRKVRSK